MSNKPIRFETQRFFEDNRNMGGGDVTIEPWNETQSVRIVANNYTCSASAYFKSPAKLRELAAKITEAAQALEDSKRLTFADLKPGDWFRVCDGMSGRDRVKVGNCYAWTFVDGVPSEGSGVAPGVRVVRIKATFEVVDE